MVLCWSEQPSYGLTTIRSTTLVTPGADQATRSASSRSIHDRTVPFRMISLPFVCGFGAWLHSYHVTDALHALQPAHCVFGSLTLILPFDLTLEGHPAVLTITLIFSHEIG